MENGSLIITKIKGNDNGKYRCAATNDFSVKRDRFYTFTVNVIPSENKLLKDKLFPSLQNVKIFIRTGEDLKLLCVNYRGNELIKWTFLPRLSTVPIKLQFLSYELKYINVTRETHDGFYNCSIGFDVQVSTFFLRFFFFNLKSFFLFQDIRCCCYLSASFLANF